MALPVSALIIAQSRCVFRVLERCGTLARSRLRACRRAYRDDSGRISVHCFNFRLIPRGCTRSIFGTPGGCQRASPRRVILDAIGIDTTTSATRGSA